MSMSDPIADMLTRIRNAQLSEKVSVAMPASVASACARSVSAALGSGVASVARRMTARVAR